MSGLSVTLFSRNTLRYPNPKTNHRFDKTDWADFFDNDYEYEDEQERRKKSAKKRKNRQNGQNHNSQSLTMGKERKGRVDLLFTNFSGLKLFLKYNLYSINC